MPSLGSSAALRRALTESVTSGSFIDTKFYVFSRRRLLEAKVDRPLALYGNSSVLKDRSDYFTTSQLHRHYLLDLLIESPVLTSGFLESALRNVNDSLPLEETTFIEDYEYELDSDLEDEETFSSTSPALLEETLDSLEPPKVTNTANAPPRLCQVITVRDAAFLT